MADSKDIGIVATIELTDGVSEPADKMSAKLDGVGSKSEETQGKLSETRAEMERTDIQSIKALSALQSVQSGIGALTSSFDTLQIGSESTRQSLKELAAGVQLVVGVGQTLKGTVAILQTLNGALRSTAIMSTIANVASQPWLAGAAIAAIGVAGGYAVSQITNNNYSYTYNGSSSSQDAKNSTSAANTGAWY